MCITSRLTEFDEIDTGALGVKYIVLGREVGKKGYKHLQGFVQWEQGVTYKTIKRRLGDPALHIEARKGTVSQAIAYCKKDGDWQEWGEEPSQGKRSDLQGVREAVAAGEGMRSIIGLGVSYQGLRYGEKLLSYLEPGRVAKPFVRWYYGDTGTGKTRAAYAEALEEDEEDVWWSQGGVRWFDGYDRHKCVILDDFRPEWCKMSVMLRMLDRYEYRVEFKGGSRQWVPEKIWITCPVHPDMCYTDTGESVAQLVRRIDVIKEF